MTSAAVVYVEDFAVGQRYRSARLAVDAAAIAALRGATSRVVQEGGRAFVIGGIASSGAHAAAFTIRLLVETGLPPAGGIIGAVAEELASPRAVLLGDEIVVEAEVIEVRPSRSRPSHGLVRLRATTLNQRAEPVQVAMMTLLVQRRAMAS